MALFPRRQAADSGLNKEEGMDQPKPKITEELEKMAHEPLLPIEKKLITWSLILGVALIIILVWVSHTFFEV